MDHIHTPKSTRVILGSELYECVCGARKWSNGRGIVGSALDAQGWYVVAAPIAKEEVARQRAIEMLQTEGYGYDWHQQDVNDPLDSHDPRNQD